MDKYYEVRVTLTECLAECYRQRQRIQNCLAQARHLIEQFKAGANPDMILSDAQDLLNSMCW
jgi:hypothetical protein